MSTIYQSSPAPGSTASFSNQPYGERLQQAGNSRHAAICSAFDSEPFLLTSLMGPVDGPEWPSDPAWLALEVDGCGAILSDGLSDPWVEKDRLATGLGLEVMVRSPEIAPLQGELLTLADSWLFPMTAEISHTLASYPRLCGRLLEGEPLSMRFNIEHIKDGRGLAGALLHQPRDLPAGVNSLATAGGDVTLIVATLLTQEELRWLGGRGEEGRCTLLERLYAEGVGSRSLARRDSVCLEEAA